MAETADQVIHFSEYFKIIRNRLWVIFTILMLTLLSGAFVTEEILPKVYTSVAEIQIHHRGEVEAPSLNPASQQDKPFDPTDFQAEFEIMQTKEILLPIIADLDLKHVWGKADLQRQPGCTDRPGSPGLHERHFEVRLQARHKPRHHHRIE